MNLNRMSSAGDLQSGVRKGLHFWRQIKPAQLLNELLLPAALCCTPQPSRQCLHEPASPQYFLKSTFKCITKALYLHAYTSSNAMQEICCPEYVCVISHLSGIIGMCHIVCTQQTRFFRCCAVSSS